ncbi:MAG: FISUMP domain-containing protein [Candidatus Falkowbacteria bacterium]
MKNKKSAFTLIELLVVIAIIGLLATIAVVALNNARSKARDAKRVADVKQMQTALDLYYNDKGYYPSSAEFAAGSLFATTTQGTTTYMAIIPTAPPQADGACTTPQNRFAYNKISDSSYTISYCLGGPVGTLAAGPKCASPEGVNNVDCSGSGSISGIGSGSNFHCGDSVDYGGQLYPTVAIASTTQCWFGKNLNYGIATSSWSQPNADSGTIYKTVYGSFTAIYQWHTAMALPAICDSHATGIAPCVVNPVHQGICPNDWHIPSDADWATLMAAVPDPGNNLMTGGSTGMDIASFGAELCNYWCRFAFMASTPQGSDYFWTYQNNGSINNTATPRSTPLPVRCIHN